MGERGVKKKRQCQAERRGEERGGEGGRKEGSREGGNRGGERGRGRKHGGRAVHTDPTARAQSVLLVNGVGDLGYNPWRGWWGKEFRGDDIHCTPGALQGCSLQQSQPDITLSRMIPCERVFFSVEAESKTPKTERAGWPTLTWFAPLPVFPCFETSCSTFEEFVLRGCA